MGVITHLGDKGAALTAVPPDGPADTNALPFADDAVRYFSSLLSFEIHCVAVWSALHQDTCPPLLDIRRPQAFRLGRLPGAVNLPLATFATAGLQVPTDRGVIVYGAGRDRLDAAEAALALARAGVAVRIMSGGYEAWKAEGFEIEGEPARASLLASI